MNSHVEAMAELESLLKSGNRTLKQYPSLLEAALLVKQACAVANGQVGVLTHKKAKAIEAACMALRSNTKEADCQIGINRIMGAPLNLVVTELIIREAAKHSISLTREDVLANQADADITATVKMLTVARLLSPLSEVGFWFVRELRAKATEFHDFVKASRSGLHDGLPVSLGDEFEGYACAMEETLERLLEEKQHWKTSALGLGEAGTGLGSSRAFQVKANEALKQISGIDIEEPRNALLALDGAHNWVTIHSHLQSLALVLWKIAHDLGLMCSGPRGGIREIAFPAVAPGSSIMPGKVNPTVAELAMLVADNVLSNGWAATLSVHSGWLNNGPTSSVALICFMNSVNLLTRTLHVFGEKVIRGITAYPDRCFIQAQSSLALVHALNYFVDAQVRDHIRELAQDKGLSVLEAAKSLQVLPNSALEDILDPKHLLNRDAVESMLARHAALLK